MERIDVLPSPNSVGNTRFVAGLPSFPVAFFFSIVSSVIGAMHSAPFLAAIQGLAKIRMRASAAALVWLSSSLLFASIACAYLPRAIRVDFERTRTESLAELAVGAPDSAN